MINQMMGIASSDLDVFILIATVLLGLCLGSFATALVHRIPRRQSWIISHSLCPSCGHRLAWFDLFPVLSWVALRGQCRYCKAPIAKRYPLIELTTLILCVVAEMIFGFTAQGIVVMLAIPFLVALVAIDLEYMILPDQLNVILWLLGLLYVCFSAGSAELPQALLAAVVYAGLSFVTSICTSLALKKVAMGMGDVKFFAVAGIMAGVAGPARLSYYRRRIRARSWIILETDKKRSAFSLWAGINRIVPDLSCISAANYRSDLLTIGAGLIILD